MGVYLNSVPKFMQIYTLLHSSGILIRIQQSCKGLFVLDAKDLGFLVSTQVSPEANKNELGLVLRKTRPARLIQPNRRYLGQEWTQ